MLGMRTYFRHAVFFIYAGIGSDAPRGVMCSKQFIKRYQNVKASIAISKAQ